jgi:hypothetical protein
MGKKRNKAGRHTAMKMKKLLQMVYLVGCIIFPGLLHVKNLPGTFSWPGRAYLISLMRGI